MGEEHPFNFEEMEMIYKKIGIARAAVDKHLDFIISPGFYVTGPKQAVNLINRFIEENDFEYILRRLILEALVKGNAFLEFDFSGEKPEMRIVNANHVYVKRDDNGNILYYNQYVGKFKKFDLTKVIRLNKENILHLKFNEIGDCAYGFGILYPALITLNNLAKSEKDMHILLGRKANTPIVATVGTPEEPATQDDIAKIGAQFEYLNNMHEWTFSHHVKLETLDFGQITDKFSAVLDHDMNMLFYIWQIPAVIMGMANVPEGLAKVQMDAFERRIQSMQAAVERLIENQIFIPLLKKHGLSNSRVEMNWGQASETKINERISKLIEILKVFPSPVLKSAIELDIANQLGYEDAIKYLETPQEAKEKMARELEGVLKNKEEEINKKEET